jgi:transcriptional regulator with XRE-family HTH domain
VATKNPDVFVRQVTKRVASARRAKGLTQEDVAERLRLALKNYQRIEYGQNITLKTLFRLARVLGVPPADLVGREP